MGVERGGEREREGWGGIGGIAWRRGGRVVVGRGVEGGGERERERISRKKKKRGGVGIGWITWSRGGRGEG